MSMRLVPASTTTPVVGEKPSISTSSWFSVFSRSSFPPEKPPRPRCRPTASISSMKMMHGADALSPVGGWCGEGGVSYGTGRMAQAGGQADRQASGQAGRAGRQAGRQHKLDPPHPLAPRSSASFLFPYRASLNRSRTRAGPTPTNISMKSDPEME
jgi:hypothetical protein